MNVLELHDVSKRFGELSALDGLSFDVKAGEIHAIVGLNGAGKTTAMRSVCLRCFLLHSFRMSRHGTSRCRRS
jgi:ABC-type multidrug transport system ATPase subunit